MLTKALLPGHERPLLPGVKRLEERELVCLGLLECENLASLLPMHCRLLERPCGRGGVPTFRGDLPQEMQPVGSHGQPATPRQHRPAPAAIFDATIADAADDPRDPRGLFLLGMGATEGRLLAEELLRQPGLFRREMMPGTEMALMIPGAGHGGVVAVQPALANAGTRRVDPAQAKGA